MLVKVKPTNGHHHLVKDTNSKAVINKDAKAFEEYVARRRIVEREEQFRESTEDRITSMASDINILRNEIKQIKDLIVQALSKD